MKGALWYGVEITGAAAHGAGVAHHDLKPSNIMVTSEGRVKALDCRLARRTHVLPGEDSTATAPGVIAGTVSYMSSEQGEGKPADARSDIFPFGSLPYQMVIGPKAFQRNS